jgi:hypothetical protein
MIEIPKRENGVPKLKWVVDKVREKVKDNPAYQFHG